MDKDIIPVPKNVLQDLKKQIDKYKRLEIRPTNFTQVAVIYSTEEISLNQLQKLVSWFKQHYKNDSENNLKLKMYGKLMDFSRNVVSSKDMKEKTSNKIRRATSHPSGTLNSSQSNSAGLQKRNVNRLNNPYSMSKASVEPAKMNAKTFNRDQLTEELNRFKKLIKDR